MFDKARNDLAARLRVLIERYTLLRQRALKWREEERLATRLGLGANYDPVLDEIIDKAEEQRALCGEAITLLLVNRSLPFLLKGGVKRAEKFANDCELYLDTMDDAAELGREAARERFGSKDD